MSSLSCRKLSRLSLLPRRSWNALTRRTSPTSTRTASTSHRWYLTTTTSASADESPSSSSSLPPPPPPPPPHQSHNNGQQEELLQAALAHVPQYGWTTDAFVAAVRDTTTGTGGTTVSLSYATTVTPTALVHYFMADCNQRLREALKQKSRSDQEPSQQQQSSSSSSVPPPPQSSFHECLYDGLQLRLRMVADPYVATGRWAQAMAVGAADPFTAWETSEQVKEIIDIVTAAASSRVTPPVVLSDTAKLALGTVYVATECHLLSDASPDYRDTWDFLRHQLHLWEGVHVGSSHSGAPTGRPSLEDVTFLASTVATAVGHGLLSVSNLSPPFGSSTTALGQSSGSFPPNPLSWLANAAATAATTATSTTGPAAPWDVPHRSSSSSAASTPTSSSSAQAKEEEGASSSA